MNRNRVEQLHTNNRTRNIVNRCIKTGAAALAMLAIISTLATSLSGCMSTTCDGDALGKQQIKLLDRMDRDGKTYHLYARTTGFQEKVVFFELYDQAPEFDQCERANVSPIYETDYNDYPDEQHVKTLTLQPEVAEKLTIVYTQDKNEGFADVYSVKFAR